MGLLYAEEHATLELQARERVCAQLIAERRKAETRPLLWALRQLYYRYIGTILAGLVLFIVVSMVWARMKA
jgi:NhaP-type Na+/H+ or K+/H+ antiporter